MHKALHSAQNTWAIAGMCARDPSMIKKIARIFETYAPLAEADSSDNVGILICGNNDSKKILITVDLTMDVVNECVRKNVQNVIAYHPVIFNPLKRITDDECIIAECIRHKIAVFSPHTSLDKRMSEFLLKLLAPGATSFSPHGEGWYSASSANTRSVGDIVRAVKEIAKLEHVRISMGCAHNNESVPSHIHVAMGSAEAMFKKTTCSDSVIVLGEMSHHELLRHAMRNTTVILLEHSNSERIFFRENKHVFEELFYGFKVILSEADRDPVSII